MNELSPEVKEILRQMDMLNKGKHICMVHDLPHHDIDTVYNHLFEVLVLVEKSGSEVVQ